MRTCKISGNMKNTIEIGPVWSKIKEIASHALASLAPGNGYNIARRRLFCPIDYMRCGEFYAILSNIEFKPGMQILDVSGPGFFTLFLAKENPGIQFTYINILDSEIGLYGDICRNAGIHNVTYLKQDIRDLTFESNLFHKVISISVIEHIFPEVGGDYNAFEQIKRVLKDDGELVLTLPYKDKRNIVYVDRAVYERGAGKKNFYAREYDKEMFETLVANSGFYIDKKYFITEKQGVFSLDYYEWGPGKDSPLSREILQLRKKIEQEVGKPLDEMLAREYLRVSTEAEYRLVNIAAFLKKK